MSDYDDYWDDPSQDEPAPDINEILFGNNFDPEAQRLMVEGLMEGNDSAYRDLVEYMWEFYDIDFEDAFDWEDFREWYESQ